MKNLKQKTGDLGQHWTPENIVQLMTSLRRNTGDVLEPSAGTGRFLRAIPEAIGVEIDPSVIPADIRDRYVLGSFFDFGIGHKFETCIGNPPYVNGKLLTPDWFGTWRPEIPITANAYLHFIEKCIQHLSDRGELIFIVPSTLFSETSKGSKLRSKMCSSGAFTDVIFADSLVQWDTAAVSTIVFRWEKGAEQNVVRTNRGEKYLFESNGFVWLVDFEVHGVFGDFFKATVGAAPSSEALKNSDSEGAASYIRNGVPVPVDETQIDSWPRKKFTKIGPKIFFLGGPTRKTARFFSGTTNRHIDHALIPLENMDCVAGAALIDEWFRKNADGLDLMDDGRWSIGEKQFENCPSDKHLKKALLDLVTSAPG